MCVKHWICLNMRRPREHREPLRPAARYEGRNISYYIILYYIILYSNYMWLCVTVCCIIVYAYIYIYIYTHYYIHILYIGSRPSSRHRLNWYLAQRVPSLVLAGASRNRLKLCSSEIYDFSSTSRSGLNHTVLKCIFPWRTRYPLGRPSSRPGASEERGRLRVRCICMCTQEGWGKSLANLWCWNKNGNAVLTSTPTPSWLAPPSWVDIYVCTSYWDRKPLGRSTSFRSRSQRDRLSESGNTHAPLFAGGSTSFRSRS